MNKQLNIWESYPLVLLIISTTGLGYFTNRSEFIPLITLASAGFIGLLGSAKIAWNVKTLFWLGLGLRIILIPSFPFFSDDFYRFLWDGHLINNGINPFSQTPELIGASSEYSQELLTNMNSPKYFTVYPPIYQWIFYAASYFENIWAGILTLRMVVIGFEIGTFFIALKILERFKLPLNKLSLYWLNPLIITELTGNLHTEGAMVFFMLLSLYQFMKIKDGKGATFLVLAVLSKLHVLMAFPLIFWKSGFKRGFIIGLITLSVIVVGYLPFLGNGQLFNMFNSLDLYFRTFEFNASLFYLIRYFGFETVGYDIIQTVGPILSIMAFLTILLISWLYRFRNRLSMFKGFTLIFITYLLTTPVVHPWYLIPALALSIFTNLKSVLAWSFLIFLSYVNYSALAHLEVLTLWIEYGVFVILLALDLRPTFSWRRIKSGLFG